MSRRLFLICYDITDHSVLQKMHRLVKGYAIGGQKSLYECWMTDSEISDFEKRVRALVNEGTDRVYVFLLDPRQEVFFGGKATRQSLSPFLVV